MISSAGLGIDIPGFGVIDEPSLVWFVILVALTLQTSFLTPPVGFALLIVHLLSQGGGTQGNHPAAHLSWRGAVRLAATDGLRLSSSGPRWPLGCPLWRIEGGG